MADGSLTFDTKIESESFNKGMDDLNKSAKTGFEKMASTVSDKIGITDIALGNMLGNLAGNLIGGAINNAGKFISDSIEIASNLAEVQNVVDTTFEGSAGEINKWAKAAKEAYGMSELKAKKYTSTIGSMFKSMGLADDQVLSMSEGITGLTGDMASFYNLDHDTAFEKLRAGISGETEPLKQLGINMSVANLEAFALSEGITKSYDSMSQAEQTTLRYNYLMSVTADAQGDFSRTSDGLANQQRILDTTLEELSATVGSIFLPAVTLAVGGLNTLVTGAKDVVTAIAGMFNTPKDELTAAVDAEKTKFTEFEQAVKDSDTTFATNKAEIESRYNLAQQYLATLAALEQKDAKTDEDVAAMKAATTALVNLYPDLKANLDPVTGLFAGGSKAIKDYIADLNTLAVYDLTKSKLEANAAAIAHGYDNLVTASATLETAQSSLAIKQAEYNALLFAQTALQQGNASSIDATTSAYLLGVPGFTNYYDVLSDGTVKVKEGMDADYALAGAIIALYGPTTDAGVATGDLAAQVNTAKTAVDGYNADIETLNAQQSELNKHSQQMIDAMNSTAPAAKIAKDALMANGHAAAEMADDLSAGAQMAEQANARLTAATDSATNVQAEQQSAIDKNSELAELTATIAANIETASTAGTGAVAALTAAKETIATDAQTAITNMENLTTTLGAYVQAMKDTLVNIISDAETEAAVAGEKFAAGTSDGYQKTPYLRTAVQSSVVQSVAVMQTYFNAFENAGYRIASNMASGVRSGSSELSGAVSAIVRAALAAARTAARSTSGGSGASGRYATGLYSVPYNGFVLEAHQNERVLTAEESKYVPRDVTSIGQATPVIDIEALASALKTGNDGGVSITVVLDGETIADVVEPKISELQGKRLRLKG